MFKKLLLSAVLVLPVSAQAAGGMVDLPQQDWSFENIREGWDKEKIYRGYQVATQVCLACHSFKYISHRNLMKVGFSEDEIKVLAKQLDLGVNDKILSPLTEEDAKAAYSKVLPDLSVMNRARPDGANYVYALLTGYEDGREDDVPEGTYYNKYFPGHSIAMPPPLTSGGLVDYTDGTESSIHQMAKDVTYFMAWTAEPEKKDRERWGVFALIYVLIFTFLTWKTKNKIWSRIKK